MTSRFVDYGRSETVTHAVETRRSLRAFKPDPVAVEVVQEIIQKAARAPSGTNTQPWQVYITVGDSHRKLKEVVCKAFEDQTGKQQGKYESEHQYYPARWFEPYQGRRRTVGWALYGLLGIEKGEREKTFRQHRRNFLFFDAPVGLMFTIHRDLEIGSWLDYGMFIQNVMLLAREAGLHTCPQVAWADYHSVIRDVLPMDESEQIVCGMTLGYADPDAIENTLVTERAELKDYVTVLE